MRVEEEEFPNYSQQDATFLDLFIFIDALYVSGGSSARHQEHKIISGIVNCNDGVEKLVINLYTNYQDIS
jgi:hypothetical protein